MEVVATGLSHIVDIKYDASTILEATQCESFECNLLKYRRMSELSVGFLTKLFSNSLNYMAYGSTKPRTEEQIIRMVERDSRRPFWTGYQIENLISGDVLGRAAIGCGYHPKDDVVGEGLYHAAPMTLDAEGPAEVQIGDFLASDPELIESLGTREELYRSMILTLLVVANAFVPFEKQGGHPVSRLTITIMDPEESGLEGVAQKDLILRNEILKSIFGEPLGVLLPDDKRNYSEHKRFVYGVETSHLDEILGRNKYSVSS